MEAVMIAYGVGVAVAGVLVGSYVVGQKRRADRAVALLRSVRHAANNMTRKEQLVHQEERHDLVQLNAALVKVFHVCQSGGHREKTLETIAPLIQRIKEVIADDLAEEETTQDPIGVRLVTGEPSRQIRFPGVPTDDAGGDHAP